ncbi:hypothetical protein [Halomonas sp. IOP_31]|uniref:hypothetical protein n=1 Tax=Halomonas sp. IOP_31 TaxID=2876584 RepID=UPI001E5CCA87|nr:hypothetical protein [Halomonas sp. IOP_31]MCD6006874.1 hypothetical protein [Halomonas sp. IOP_31]
MLSRIAEGDRRCKPEEERLDNVIKTRFRDAEFLAFEQMADLRHEGKVACAVRECALIGMEIVNMKQDVLLARLAEGRGLQDAQDDMIETLMAHLVEKRITDRMMQRLTA